MFTQTRPDINTPGVVVRQLSADVLSTRKGCRNLPQYQVAANSPHHLCPSVLKVYIDQIAPLVGIILPTSVCTIDDAATISPITLAACAIASASRKSPTNVFLALRSKLWHTLQGEVMGVSNLKNVQTLMIACMSAVGPHVRHRVSWRKIDETPLCRSFMGGIPLNLVRRCGCVQERSVWQLMRRGSGFDPDHHCTPQAIRQAQDLGFHCEPGPLHTGDLLEQRVRAWLSCLVTDQWWVPCGTDTASMDLN